MSIGKGAIAYKLLSVNYIIIVFVNLGINSQPFRNRFPADFQIVCDFLMSHPESFELFDFAGKDLVDRGGIGKCDFDLEVDISVRIAKIRQVSPVLCGECGLKRGCLNYNRSKFVYFLLMGSSSGTFGVTFPRY